MTEVNWPVCHDHLALAINNGISLGRKISVELPEPVECSSTGCSEESLFEVVWDDYPPVEKAKFLEPLVIDSGAITQNIKPALASKFIVDRLDCDECDDDFKCGEHRRPICSHPKEKTTNFDGEPAIYCDQCGYTWWGGL